MNKFTIKSALCTLLLMVGVNAWAEDYTLTISPSDFTTASYADNNGSHTLQAVSNEDDTKTMSVDVTTNQVYQNTGAIQWQKNNGYIYNTTDLGTIKSVTVNSTAGTFTTYYGTAQNPTSDTSIGNGFFTVKVGSATGKTSNIVIVFDPSNAAAPKAEAQISASNYAESLNIGENDEYTITYDGDGELSISSSDETVAEAIIDENNILIAAVGKGTTTITITASETENYKSSEFTYILNVKSNVARPTDEIFYESFDDCDGTGGNDGSWSGSIASGNAVTDNTGWTLYKQYGADGCLKLGTGSAKGYATTPSISGNGNYVLTFKAAAWAKDNKTLILSAENATLSQKTVTMQNSTWTEYCVLITNATDGFKITFSANQESNNRFFLDEISICALTELDEVTVTSAGYATYVAPMNMIIGDGTVAKYITGVAENGTTLTLEDAPVVAENEAVLLVGEGTHKVYGSNKLSATKNDNNKLVAADNAPVGSYVLQSQSGVVGFYQVEGEPKSTNGHAYLDLANTSVKAFNLNTIATGIQQLNTTKSNVTYDLMGRRVSNAQKGIFIVNGKKVIK